MPIPADVAAAARKDGVVQDVLSDRAAGLAVDLVGAGALRSPERWRDGVAGIAPQLLELQTANVAAAETYLTAVLGAQGASTAAEAQLAVDGFADLTDGGGSWLRNLVFAPPAVYQRTVRDVGQAGAGARARFVAAAIAGDGVRDTGRAARTVAMAARPAVKWYVRMLNGRSCARCALLAGRRYRVSAFRRHPRLPAATAATSPRPRRRMTGPRTLRRTSSR